MSDQKPRTFGPYASEREAIADAQDVLRLNPGVEWDLATAAKVRQACADAGVDLGAYDERVIDWLARWEPQAVQVIVGLISRAGAR
jgi:hypothetical protein